MRRRGIWLGVFGVFACAGAWADGAPVLPDGPGRDLVAARCGQCHSLDTVLRAHLTRRQWEARIDTMIAKGAKVSDEEFDVVAEYLATHFGWSPAAP